MPTIGIIAEYNPFHNGHVYQLQKIRELYPDCRIITVISGGFTQRGECAILSKWQRAESAVRHGADLVLELPACYAVRSAQDFAMGGVKLLNSLGIVDMLAFGMESTDLDILDKIANFTESDRAQELLQREIKKGTSYGAALRKVIISHDEFSHFTEILSGPNTVLALEYLRALKHTGSAMKPLAIHRTETDHHSTEINTNIASGTAIRQEITQAQTDWQKVKQAVPNITFNQLSTSDTPDTEMLYRSVLHTLSQATLPFISSIYTINEGLENRLIASMKNSHSLQGIVDNTSAKRYTKSRIMRSIFYLLLGLTKEHIFYLDNLLPQYARVLAFEVKGRDLLREIKNTTPVPIITKLSDYITSQDMRSGKQLTDLQAMLTLDIRSTDLQATCMNKPIYGRDFITSPVYVK